ncbi:MAG TPA: type II secretion system secretin GspD [Caulobacteraceae bacterium]|nr:type II secretion system secretin GspD [Caulobacteraceae bacterium]
MRPTLTKFLILAVLSATPLCAQTDTSPSTLDDRQVRTTILPGTTPTRPAPPAPVQVVRGGDVTLNFPSVDVHAVAKAILGDTLHLPYSVDRSVQGQVTLQTQKPIRRADILAFFERALASANLVLADRSGIYTILPAGVARGEAPVVGPADTGYGNETIQLKFVNAEELRKLLDPLVPNAISVADAEHNVLVVSGTSVQRTALRELVGQFDVDWLKGMSFALFVPQRTDARLITPELEKLLNAPGSASAGLVRLITMERLNGILAISPQRQYLDDVARFVEVLDREGEGAERRIFVYHVQNGRAADLTKVLDGAFGIAAPRGSVTDTNPTELNDVTSRPSLLTATANAVGMLPLQAARVTAAAAQVANARETAPEASTATAASPDATTITADEANNAIVVFATPRNYAVIEDALRKLDVPPLQVMIDASVSEVTLNHQLQYGIQWSFNSGNSSGALTQGTTSTPVQNFPGFSYMYSGGSVTAVLNALRQITDVKVLSAPKLMVINNHTATIDVGEEVPISTGSAISTVTTGAPVVNSIDYKQTGIILKVTPRVNSGGLVLLDIAQEVSDVLPQSTAQVNSGSGIDSPTFEERKISTSVAVQDGETVALGGLMKNEIQKGRSTIPLLGDIPFFGHLFGDTTAGLLRTELIVTLTPRVVRTPVDARAITDELRGKIELAPPPPPPPPPAPPPLPRFPKARRNG